MNNLISVQTQLNWGGLIGLFVDKHHENQGTQQTGHRESCCKEKYNWELGYKTYPIIS